MIALLVTFAFAVLVMIALVYQLTRQIQSLRDAILDPVQAAAKAIGDPAFNFDAVMTQLKKMATAQQIGQTSTDFAQALDVENRLQVAKVIALIGILDGKVDIAAEHSVDVAEDLAATHQRADNAGDEGPSGTASDAAM